MSYSEVITTPTLKKYKIAEVILANQREFVFVLIHPNPYYPSICASIRFVPSINGALVSFSEKILSEKFRLALSAHEELELEMITLSEDLQKCMYVKHVMTLI